MSKGSKNVPASDPKARTSLADDVEGLSAQLDELEELIREHPLATLGIAMVAGLAVALILSRR